jgi:CheY-like chemotaxis protein
MNVVLAVDDEALVLEVIQSALEEGGFSVRTADSAAAAMELLDSSQPEDFAGLVTDVNLGPTVSGWDVARRGRELNPQLPIVYVTGDSGHDWEVHGVPRSVLVQKLFAPAQIVVALASLLNAPQSDH